jgi:hemerythrin-like metal-binding protein
MEWTNEFSVNNQEMDDQHKRLFNLIEKLNKAMQEGKSNSILNSVLEELSQYAVIHFKDEESLMANINEHRSFVDKLYSFKQAINNKELGVSIRVINFLRDWLKSHILQIDKEYSSYLN